MTLFAINLNLIPRNRSTKKTSFVLLHSIIATWKPQVKTRRVYTTNPVFSQGSIHRLRTFSLVRRFGSEKSNIPYARHYNPRFVLFLPHISFSLKFILQTIYVLKTKILYFLSLKSAVYIGSLFLMKSVL